MNDTISDMLCRIGNAVSAKHKTVDVKQSKVCLGIAQVLKEEGFIEDFTALDDGTGQGLIRIQVKYTPTGERVIHEIKRLSKPGCRVYREVDRLPAVQNGMGIVLLSTSKGVLSDRKAREMNMGGEVLATVK
ncbi:MAG: 30S ribosomal protein S8 [Phycisphaerae bacterium]